MLLSHTRYTRHLYRRYSTRLNQLLYLLLPSTLKHMVNVRCFFPSFMRGTSEIQSVATHLPAAGCAKGTPIAFLTAIPKLILQLSRNQSQNPLAPGLTATRFRWTCHSPMDSRLRCRALQNFGRRLLARCSLCFGCLAGSLGLFLIFARRT